MATVHNRKVSTYVLNIHLYSLNTACIVLYYSALLYSVPFSLKVQHALSCLPILRLFLCWSYTMRASADTQYLRSETLHMVNIRRVRLSIFAYMRILYTVITVATLCIQWVLWWVRLCELDMLRTMRSKSLIKVNIMQSVTLLLMSIMRSEALFILNILGEKTMVFLRMWCYSLFLLIIIWSEILLFLSITRAIFCLFWVLLWSRLCLYWR